MNLIEVHDVSKYFKSNVVFEKLNLNIPNGKLVSIYGDSGTGKTTLLNMIGMIEELDGGEIKLFDRSVKEISNKQKRNLFRYEIAFIFQNFGLIDDKSIFDNLNIALYFHQPKLDKNSKEKLMHEVLSSLKVDYLELKTPIYKLSGGEQQRVAISRAILKDAKLILADEATGALDQDNKVDVMNIFKSLRNQGKTIVIVTHDPYVIEQSDLAYDIKNLQVKSF